jgi:hypothetical protein
VIFFQMLSSKDLNFVGYTYKNFELVNDHDVPGMGTALSGFFFIRVVSLGDNKPRTESWRCRLFNLVEKEGSESTTESSFSPCALFLCFSTNTSCPPAQLN